MLSELSMWEIPLFGVILPIFTIIFSIFIPIKYHKYFVAPVLIFIILSIPTIILSIFQNVGWGSLFGWTVFYTVLSLLISFIVWLWRLFLQE